MLSSAYDGPGSWHISNSLNPHYPTYKIGALFIPLSQMRKLRHREIKELVQSHTDGKRRPPLFTQSLPPSLLHLAPKSWTFKGSQR